MALALVAVGTATAGDRKLYVVGGQQLDREFLSTLVLAEGMRVLLYRSIDSRFSPAELIDASGPAARADRLRSLIEEVRQERRETAAVIGSGADAETFHAIPLAGADGSALGVLLVGSSRRALALLETSLLLNGIAVAIAGILTGLAVSWWASSRITRPVLQLARSAGRVAAGDWNATVDITSGDEIGQLAQAFNRKTEELVAQRERLVQAERVAAWRELARRLAHELKNPLFPLQITVENMKRAREQYPEQFDEVFQESAATLLAELANLKQIIGRFSDFAKMPPPELQQIDVNRVVEQAMGLYRAQLAAPGHPPIQPRMELTPDLPPVAAEPEQFGRAPGNPLL